MSNKRIICIKCPVCGSDKIWKIIKDGEDYACKCINCGYVWK